MGRKAIEIELGTRFNNWTVLTRVESKGGLRWLCKCQCGNESTLRGNYLRYRAGSCKSCANKEHSLKSQDSPHWNGFEEITGTKWKQIRESARKRKIEFDIEIEETWNLFEKQNRRCALSGIEIVMNKSASLDRIDSLKGYTSDNVQWVHKTMNLMKNKLPQDEFIEWCRLVSNRWISVSY